MPNRCYQNKCHYYDTKTDTWPEAFTLQEDRCSDGGSFVRMNDELTLFVGGVGKVKNDTSLVSNMSVRFLRMQYKNVLSKTGWPRGTL